MTGSKNLAATTRCAAILAAALLVQGCANAYPKAGATPEKATATTVAPTSQARAKSASVKPTTTAAQTRKASLKTVPKAGLDLNVTYFVRLMVPAGSELKLRAVGAGPATEKVIKTDAGPPYSVRLPMPDESGMYPMTVTATLNSSIGHVLEGKVTLAEAPAGTVEIVMVPKSDG